jgi:type III secretory pathway component EscS
MDKPRITPKDFFLWAGAMISLYWSAVAFIFLLIDYINYAMPNPLAYYPADPYQSGIPYCMASIIVLFPIYLGLAWFIHSDIARDPSRADVWVRRWAIIFTLFVAGATVAGDLIILLTTFLRGEEITLAFIFKVLVVLLVAAGAFMHFIADLWGYWTQFPKRRNSVAWSVGALALISIVGGFFIVGTPGQARLYRFDDQKVSDLEQIQYQVVNYYQHKQQLPLSLADLHDTLSNVPTPTDPQTNQAYEYRATGALSFDVCANFNAPTRVGSNANNGAYSAPIPASYRMNQNNWQHGAGRVCFDRTIDPALYPPASVPTKGL